MQKLYIDVWDADLVGSDDLLGSVSVEVERLCAEGASEDGLELSLSPCGRIWVAAQWEDLLLLENRDAGCTSTKGFLFVGVYSASDLPAQKAGAMWWVQASCSGVDLDGCEHEMQTTKHIMPTVPPDCGGDEDTKASRAAAKELETKLTLLAKYGVKPQDAATLLEMDQGRVETLSAKLQDGLNLLGAGGLGRANADRGHLEPGVPLPGGRVRGGGGVPRAEVPGARREALYVAYARVCGCRPHGVRARDGHEDSSGPCECRASARASR
ncbi:unnamed protein product [Prorocentrum cordatum]|uniref:Uncharacterized protein n=1 Tax=Prorocentrum cordatum TaxID=2364126 RepID=A0ABN9V9B1_9DINO|nr:unnamed protein product [Polarella glacialis]